MWAGLPAGAVVGPAAGATGAAVGRDFEVVLHVVVCPDAAMIVGNHDADVETMPGVDPDELAKPWLAADATPVSGAVPPGCRPGGGWGARFAVDRAMTSIVVDHDAADGGALSVDAGDLDPAHRRVLERGDRLWVAPVAPDGGGRMVAFRCQDDATNGDAVEYVWLAPGATAHCVVFTVDDTAPTDAGRPQDAAESGATVGDGRGDDGAEPTGPGPEPPAARPVEVAPTPPSGLDPPTAGGGSDDPTDGADSPPAASGPDGPDGAPTPTSAADPATGASAGRGPGDDGGTEVALPLPRIGVLRVRVEVGGVTAGGADGSTVSPWTEPVSVVVGCEEHERVELALPPGAVPGSGRSAELSVPLDGADTRTCDIVTIEDGVAAGGQRGRVRVTANGDELGEGDVLPVLVSEGDASVTLALTYAASSGVDVTRAATTSTDPPVLAAAEGLGGDAGLPSGTLRDVIVLTALFVGGLALTAQRSRRPL